jgi:hypothetical protein
LKTGNVPINFQKKELIADVNTRLNMPQNLQPDENYTTYQVISTTINPSTCSAEGYTMKPVGVSN